MVVVIVVNDKLISEVKLFLSYRCKLFDIFVCFYQENEICHMKKQLLLASFTFLLGMQSVLMAQSFELEETTSYDFGSVQEDLATHTVVRNISSSVKRVFCKSEVINVVAGSEVFFCWEECYDPSVVESPTYIEVNPNEVIDLFHGYIRPNGFPGISTVRFSFYSSTDASDSIAFIGTFEASPVGISKVKNQLSELIVYPNPADEKVNISVTQVQSENAVIELYNMLGSLVVSIPIKQNDELITIPTAQLKAGVYFFTLRSNGKTSKPGRLTIKH